MCSFLLPLDDHDVDHGGPIRRRLQNKGIVIADRRRLFSKYEMFVVQPQFNRTSICSLREAGRSSRSADLGAWDASLEGDDGSDRV